MREIEIPHQNPTVSVATGNVYRWELMVLSNILKRNRICEHSQSISCKILINYCCYVSIYPQNLLILPPWGDGADPTHTLSVGCI